MNDEDENRIGLHMNLHESLAPTYFLNHDHPEVQEYAHSLISTGDSDKEKAVKLFRAVRDRFAYDPYNVNLTREAMRASEILKRNSAYCNEKAIVLAACLRYHGIPARLYFGNVRNHIATEKLQKLLRTDIMAFHGCVEIYLDGRWLKATPAFNESLCHKLGVEPLAFTGEGDAVLQQFSADGRRFMEYLEIHGSFNDMPVDLFVAELRKHYGHLIQEDETNYRLGFSGS